MTIVLQQIHHINQVCVLAWPALHGKAVLGEEKKSCLINVINKILIPSDARKKRKAPSSNRAALPSMNADELSRSNCTLKTIFCCH